jgi:hypothetical protein
VSVTQELGAVEGMEPVIASLGHIPRQATPLRLKQVSVPAGHLRQLGGAPRACIGTPSPSNEAWSHVSRQWQISTSSAADVWTGGSARLTGTG